MLKAKSINLIIIKNKRSKVKLSKIEKNYMLKIRTIIKSYFQVNQLNTNHDKLEYKEILGLNRQNLDIITCKVICRQKVMIIKKYYKQMHLVIKRKANNLICTKVDSILQ